MSFFLDYVCRRPKATVHVLDDTRAEGPFRIELRVPSHVLKQFGSDGELFATTNAEARLKSGRIRAFLRNVFIADRAYAFMEKASWDELVAQYRTKPQQPNEALQQPLEGAAADSH